jgi:hypothetical protein
MHWSHWICCWAFSLLIFYYPELFRGRLTWFGWDLRFTAFYVFSTYFLTVGVLGWVCFCFIEGCVYDLMLVRSLIFYHVILFIGLGVEPRTFYIIVRNRGRRLLQHGAQMTCTFVYYKSSLLTLTCNRNTQGCGYYAGMY